MQDRMNHSPHLTKAVQTYTCYSGILKSNPFYSEKYPSVDHKLQQSLYSQMIPILASTIQQRDITSLQVHTQAQTILTNRGLHQQCKRNASKALYLLALIRLQASRGTSQISFGSPFRHVQNNHNSFTSQSSLGSITYSPFPRLYHLK